MVKLKGYPLLNNITLLYFIFILAIINIGGFIYIKDNQSIFLFACVAIIIYFFNPNMIIVLLTTMIIVNMLIVLNRINGPSEGYKNEDDEEDEKKEEKKEENEEDTQSKSIKESLKNDKEPNEVNKLTDVNEVLANEINEKIKKILPSIKTDTDTVPLDLNEINKHINNLTSTLE
jgi:hypothetical protein